ESVVDAAMPGFPSRNSGEPAARPRTHKTARPTAGGETNRPGVAIPLDEIVEASGRCIIFDEIPGQPIAHLDQMGEKETRSIGLQLCEIAEQLHLGGWIYNAFEPYNVIVDRAGVVRLMVSDRVRRLGSFVDQAPVYPSRGYTAPELFEQGAVYDARMDV